MSGYKPCIYRLKATHCWVLLYYHLGHGGMVNIACLPADSQSHALALLREVWDRQLFHPEAR